MLRNFWGEAVLQWFIVCSLILKNLKLYSPMPNNYFSIAKLKENAR